MKQTSRYSSIPPAERLPEWLRRPIGNASDLEAVQGVVKQQRLHTICEEGRCPNRGECYAAGTATFLLGGPICTRSCAFCQVDKGQAPHPLDPLEAERVAEAVETLQLRYVVLTAVPATIKAITEPACSPKPWQRFGPAIPWWELKC